MDSNISLLIMAGVGGVDLSVATANRVRSLDVRRAGTNQIPSIANPGLSANPDLDTYGRPTGLNLTSGNRVSDRTIAVLESIAQDNHPDTSVVSSRMTSNVRNALYDQTRQQAEYQYVTLSGQNLMNTGSVLQTDYDNVQQ